MSRSVTVRAPGKINLGLRVGALQDDGYHDVASLYQAVSLYEEVTATASDTFSVNFTGPIDCSGLATDDTNLALRAAKLLASHTGSQHGVALTVNKHVPIAGGMGGGSADAAASLLACDELWGTGVGKHTLMDLGGQLGADVPFALEGGTAIGTGRGDRLTQALTSGEHHWVLVFAATGLSTPQVYAELDRHRQQHVHDLPTVNDTVRIDSGLLQAVRSGDLDQLAESLHNDLQPAALKLRPELSETLEFGDTRGALASLVSGSGPTCAFLTADTQAAAQLRHAFESRGATAVCVTGPVRGARIVRGME